MYSTRQGVCWGNRRRKTCEGLFFLHSSTEPFKALVGGLFDEGHVFTQVLFGVDLPFLPPLLLVEPELGDRGAVFLVQRFPDRRTGGLFGNGVLVAGWIGCPCGAPARSQQDECQRQCSQGPSPRGMNSSTQHGSR